MTVKVKVPVIYLCILFALAKRMVLVATVILLSNNEVIWNVSQGNW